MMIKTLILELMCKTLNGINDLCGRRESSEQSYVQSLSEARFKSVLQR